MKRSSFWLVILLFVLIAFVGCKDSPNNVPNGQENDPTETVIHDALSQGLSRQFESGKDATGITLAVKLNNGIKFKDIKVGDDITHWFGDSLGYDGIKAEIKEISPVARNINEENFTAIIIGFSGSSKTAPVNFHINIPAENLVGSEKDLGVVIDGHVYTVKFNIFGDDGYKNIEQEVHAGKKATNPDTVGVGYQVNKWTYNDELNNNYEFNFDTIITHDYYLEGYGTAIRTVTFEYYDGKPNKEVVVVKGEKVQPPNDTSRNGYNFDGWYLDSREYDFDSAVTNNITLKGRWLNTSGKVIINWYVGNNKINSTVTQLGKTITPIADPNDHKESIADTFKHWTADTETNTPFDFNTTKALEDINLYAVWNELNFGDTFILKDDYIGENGDLKQNGIEVVIIGKRGFSSYATGWKGLPSDYPYKYIAVDKNHDLSFYVNGSDYISYNVYGEQWQDDSRDYLACTYWAPELLETGGRGTATGTGLQNTKCALALNGTLFNIEGSTDDVQFLWSWFVKFKGQINSQYENLWFVPSLDELSLIKYVDEKLENWATKGQPLYWTSTETNRQIFIGSLPVQQEKYVCAYYDYNGFHSNDGPFAEYKNHKNNQKTQARTRLCRVL